jgi:hypothetical protein
MLDSTFYNLNFYVLSYDQSLILLYRQYVSTIFNYIHANNNNESRENISELD